MVRSSKRIIFIDVSKSLTHLFVQYDACYNTTVWCIVAVTCTLWCTHAPVKYIVTIYANLNQLNIQEMSILILQCNVTKIKENVFLTTEVYYSLVL